MGHCHPRITSKIKEQLDRLQHTTTIYLNDQHSLFAEELASKLPEGLDCIYFTSSGSEANSIAQHMSRVYTGNYPIIALRNGYHGMGGISHLTNIPSWNHNLPKTNGVELTDFPDEYRGKWNADTGARYAQDVKDTIEFSTSGQIAMYIAEPVMGVGGIHPLPKGYLKDAVKFAREAGGVYASDEVQTGFGRTGLNYWGFEMHEVVPDIVTMAKQIGNGFPLAAVACTKEIG